MLRIFNKIFRNPLYLGIFILIFLLLFSLKLRQQEFEKVIGAQNLIATYHVLLTVTALNENPPENHWLLPTVTLGKESDKNIPWGAAAPTQTGDYIYTSFTPPGFLAPYVWFKAFNLEPSVKNLAYFNFALGSLASFALFFLIVNLLKFNGYDSWTSVGGALIGCTIGIFSREALLSHGLVYWTHSLYQPILIFSLYIIFKFLGSETKEKRYTLIMIVAAFLGPLTEWSGYLFNAGLVFLLWLNGRASAPSRVLAKQIFIATAMAGILTVIHFSLAIGFERATVAFLERFLARNISTGSVVGLIQGYGLSYGLFILTLLSILALSYFDHHAQERNTRNANFFIFAASCVPLLENIIMLQHASEFSFDRLKFILPAALIFAFSYASFGTKGRVALLAFILLSCLHGYNSYEADLESYSSWSTIDVENRKLASQIASRVDVACTVFATNLDVRGYVTLLFHHGIYEYKSIQETPGLMAKRNACASVYLDSTRVFPGLQKYTNATITYRDGTTAIINNESLK